MTTPRRRAGSRSIAVAATVVLALVGLTCSVTSAAAAPAAAAPTAALPHPAAAAQTWIVQLVQAPADQATVQAVTAAVQRAGGTLTQTDAAIGSVVVKAPAAAQGALLAVPGVKSVSPDGVAHATALTFDPATQPGSLTNVTRITGAQDLWKKGITGAGVDVAVVDTGVVPVDALADPSKVVVGPDLSFESQSPNLRYLDSFGHGTNMAGIIGGREVPKGTGSAYAVDTKNFYGMAPDSRLVSIKVGANDGAVDVSQLIAAINWVLQHRFDNGMNIKVLNLSFGTDSTQSWQVDPLAQAAEVAARMGILVVAAAGNDGAKSSGLADPAADPYVLSVGAVNTQGTDSYTDDAVPSFSQHSDAAMAARAPDLVAPGVGIVAPAVAGSSIATAYPNALIGGSYIRGSGTSQAAAVVSGAAALAWQKWPYLTALQIREMLVSSTTQVGTSTQAYEGHGELDLRKFATATPSYDIVKTYKSLNMPWTIGLGTGSLDAARGTQRIAVDGVTLTGDQDIFGKSWTSCLAGLIGGLGSWAGGLFNFNTWIGSGFSTDTTSVAGKAWSGRTWSGVTWSGRTWSGRTWSGETWSGRTWSGRTWSSGSWGDAVTPVGGNWASQTWASTLWE